MKYFGLSYLFELFSFSKLKWVVPIQIIILIKSRKHVCTVRMNSNSATSPVDQMKIKKKWVITIYNLGTLWTWTPTSEDLQLHLLNSQFGSWMLPLPIHKMTLLESFMREGWLAHINTRVKVSPHIPAYMISSMLLRCSALGV